MLGGNRPVRLVALLVLILAIGHKPAEAGDRIAALAATLSSSSDKARLSAVVSLARLNDKRALKPLVTALHDPNAQVRALAASALGRLGHKAALPALRGAALDDSDELVRTKSREAAMAVAKANKIKDDLPALPSATVAVAARVKTTGFGRSPRAVESRPDLYVTIKGANDDSPGKADKTTRKANAEIIRRALQDSLTSAPQVTLAATEAQRWGLEPRTIDVSVVKMDVVQSAGYVEIAAELRLAISDTNGKMLSFLSGGAKVQIPQRKFNAKFLPSLRQEALEGAMRGLFDKLLVHLRQITTT